MPAAHPAHLLTHAKESRAPLNAHFPSTRRPLQARRGAPLCVRAGRARGAAVRDGGGGGPRLQRRLGGGVCGCGGRGWGAEALCSSCFTTAVTSHSLYSRWGAVQRPPPCWPAHPYHASLSRLPIRTQPNHPCPPELPDEVAHVRQAEDRAHRQGQRKVGGACVAGGGGSLEAWGHLATCPAPGQLDGVKGGGRSRASPRPHPTRPPPSTARQRLLPVRQGHHRRPALAAPQPLPGPRGGGAGWRGPAPAPRRRRPRRRRPRCRRGRWRPGRRAQRARGGRGGGGGGAGGAGRPGGRVRARRRCGWAHAGGGEGGVVPRPHQRLARPARSSSSSSRRASRVRGCAVRQPSGGGAGAVWPSGRGGGGRRCGSCLGSACLLCTTSRSSGSPACRPAHRGSSRPRSRGRR